MSATNDTNQPSCRGSCDDDKHIRAANRYEITVHTIERGVSTGRYATGTVNGHRFSAKVYTGHALYPSCELGTSGIAKLQVWQMGDGKEVAHFERGWDMLPRTDAAQQVVNVLGASLQDLVFPEFALASKHDLGHEKPRATRDRPSDEPRVVGA